MRVCLRSWVGEYADGGVGLDGKFGFRLGRWASGRDGSDLRTHEIGNMLCNRGI